LRQEAGRDLGKLWLVVALREVDLHDVDALAASGVDELVLAEAPPGDPDTAANRVAALASRWLPALA